MIVEKDIIRCEAIFDETRKHRLTWRRVWDKNKPLAAVLMLNPNFSDNIETDTTTTLTVNHIARLEEYGGVIVINLYSRLTPKLNFRWNDDNELNHPENDTYILKAAEEASIMILAWGKSAENHQRMTERVNHVMEMLKPHQEKLCQLSDGKRTGLHPLTPTLRKEWILDRQIAN